jgi:hypothetical protein
MMMMLMMIMKMTMPGDDEDVDDVAANKNNDDVVETISDDDSRSSDNSYSDSDSDSSVALDVWATNTGPHNFQLSLELFYYAVVCGMAAASLCFKFSIASILYSSICRG